MKPSVTIITSTLNCADALILTANSIREQNYTDIQWIVADGGSTDKTIEIINKNQDVVSIWFSSKDEGIYHAWNKASRYISSDWVIFLGAGDVFESRQSLTEFWNAINEIDDEEKILYGNVIYLDESGNSRYISRKPHLNFWEFGRPALPHHQGTFQHKSLIFANTFDTSYKVAADSKFLLKSLKKCTSRHVDVTLTKMYAGGVSNKISNLLNAEAEIKRVCRELEIYVPFFIKLEADFNRRFLILINLILPLRIVNNIKSLLDMLRIKKHFNILNINKRK